MPTTSVADAEAIDVKILLSFVTQVKAGDFSARMPLDWTVVAGKVADGLNEVVVANEQIGAELARVSRVVGKQGELSQRVVLDGWTQSWSGNHTSTPTSPRPSCASRPPRAGATSSARVRCAAAPCRGRRTSNHDHDLDLTRELLAAVFEQLPQAVLLATDDRYIAAKATARGLLGVTTEELRHRRIDDFFSPDTRDSLDALSSASERAGIGRAEIVLVRPDGQKIPIRTTARANLRPGHHLSVLAPLTDR